MADILVNSKHTQSRHRWSSTQRALHRRGNKYPFRHRITSKRAIYTKKLHTLETYYLLGFIILGSILQFIDSICSKLGQ